MRVLPRFLHAVVLVAGFNVCGVVHAALIAQYDFTGNADDSSGNNLNGIVMGAELTSDRFGNSQNAYLFDGTDSVDVAYDPLLNPTSGEWSMSAWVQSTVGGFILGKGGQRPSYGLLTYRPFSPDNLRVVAWCCEGGDHLITGSSTSSVLDGDWHNVVGSIRNNDSAKLYLDGALIATDNTPNIAWNINFAAPFQIGDISRASGEPFIGRIDEVRLFNHVLSQKEIIALAGIPEPGGFVVAALGLTALLLWRRRLTGR